MGRSQCKWVLRGLGMFRMMKSYVSVHPLSIAIAFCIAVSFARFFEPILHVLPFPLSDNASSSDSNDAVVSCGQPFTAMSTPIVPVNATSSNAAQETNVVSIFDATLLKSSTPPILRKLLQPWNISEAEVMREVFSPPISCKFVQP